MTDYNNTIIATSDWHLGRRLYGLRHLEFDRYKAANVIVDHALRVNARALLVGGDVLDVTRPNSQAVNELMAIHERAVAGGLPVLIVQGNHDRTAPPWYDIFKSSGRGGIRLIDDQLYTLEPRHATEQTITVLGLPEKPAGVLREELKSAPAADVLLMHVSIKEWCGFPSETALSLDDIPAKWSHAVIGDTHTPQVVHVSGGMTAISPGSIELGGKTETTQKRFLSIDVATRAVESIDLETRAKVHVRLTEDSEIESGLKEIEAGVQREAVIYVTYDPFIPGLSQRIERLKTGNAAYIVPEANIVEADLLANADDEEEDDDLSVADFVSRHTDDELLQMAFERLVNSSDNVEDIVRAMEEQARKFAGADVEQCAST